MYNDCDLCFGKREDKKIFLFEWTITTLLYSERLFAASLYIINNILANRITSSYECLLSDSI